jgi:hypothetical protein
MGFLGLLFLMFEETKFKEAMGFRFGTSLFTVHTRSHRVHSEWTVACVKQRIYVDSQGCDSCEGSSGGESFECACDGQL